MIINKQKYNNNLINKNNACSLCRKKIISFIQCLKCKNIFCEICFENKCRNTCPFKCFNPSFKNERFLKYKEKYSQNLYLLKQNKELKNNLYISEIRKIYSNHLNNSFKSIYHSHTLYNRYNCENKYYDWICDICEKKYQMKSISYRCDKCNFDICIKCRILEESGYNFKNIFLSKYHEHLLKDETLRENNWICDVCNKRYEMKSEKRFRCENCDFDICKNCKNTEEMNVNGIFFNLLIFIFDFSIINPFNLLYIFK